MIEAQSVGKSYGSFVAVRDVSFSVLPGEILGLLGPNGAGKTTIMRILTGYHFPSRGRALVGGVDVTRDPPAVKAMVGYLPENAPVYGEFTVAEYLDFVAGARRIPGKDRREAVEKAVESCGLSPVYRRGIEKLSKGYRQRVGLAQAILHDPPILILDEPTAGLDPNQIVEIRRLIRALGTRKTLILSTHILREVEALCDGIVILNEGLVAARGTREEIADRMKGDERYRVLITQGPPVTRESLAEVRDAKGVESLSPHPGGGWEALVLFPSGSSGGEALFDWAVERGHKLGSLAREDQGLESLFSRLTEEDHA